MRDKEQRETELLSQIAKQVEHFGSPSTTVNDAFRAVSRYWDRIVAPEQVVHSLPLAVETMLDPADCGPAFIGLPQDVQAESWDYPTEFFEPRVHELRRSRPDLTELEHAVAALRDARRPLVVAGGGVHYSLAEESLRTFAERLASLAGWEPGKPDEDDLLLRAQLVLAAAMGIGVLRATGAPEPLMSATEAELATPVHDLVTALLAGYPDLSIEETARQVLPKVKGAFSLVFMDEHTLYAARDPQGIRPLVLGRLERGWVVASETAALDIVGASFIR